MTVQDAGTQRFRQVKVQLAMDAMREMQLCGGGGERVLVELMALRDVEGFVGDDLGPHAVEVIP